MSGAKIIEGLEQALEMATPIKKPAKVWWNWWRAKRSSWVCRRCGASGSQLTGSVVRGHCSFPSKDMAETFAAENAEKGPTGEYLGAYPEGERP